MDNILFWNDVALEANRISFTNGKGEQPGPTLSSRALAIVHLAMYDAYVAIDKDAGASYLSNLPTAPESATTQAAVSGAAYSTLTALYPSQKVLFDAKLSEAALGTNPGYYFGLQVGKAILDDRKDDPGVGSDGYFPLGEYGKHKEDPDNPGQGFHAPFYGSRSKGFAITQRHELDEPPFKKAEDKAEYEYALRQVRGKGIAPELMGTVPSDIEARTPNETLMGIYWGYDGARGLGTPPRLYNQIIRKVAITKGNSEAQNARLFALVNVAMADAGILAWDQKYIHNFWRPVVGIREHDSSMGDFTQANNPISEDCDPAWLPLGGPSTNALNEKLNSFVAPTFPHATTAKEVVKNFSPNFPAYPSGHATFGSAALHMTRLFYNQGGKLSDNTITDDQLFDRLDFVSDEFNGSNQDNKGTVRPRHARTFPRGLWEMIEENGLSRVYLGVHWAFDAFAIGTTGEIDLSRNIGGVPLGLKIAEDIFSSGMSVSSVGPR